MACRAGLTENAFIDMEGQKGALAPFFAQRVELGLEGVKKARPRPFARPSAAAHTCSHVTHTCWHGGRERPAWTVERSLTLVPRRGPCIVRAAQLVPLGELSALEKSHLEKLLPTLRAEHEKGVLFASKL